MRHRELRVVFIHPIGKATLARRHRLTPSQRALLWHLIEFAYWETQTFTGTMTAIAEDSGLARKTIADELAVLEALGLIEVLIPFGPNRKGQVFIHCYCEVVDPELCEPVEPAPIETPDAIDGGARDATGDAVGETNRDVTATLSRQVTRQIGPDLDVPAYSYLANAGGATAEGGTQKSGGVEPRALVAREDTPPESNGAEPERAGPPAGDEPRRRRRRTRRVPNAPEPRPEDEGWRPAAPPEKPVDTEEDWAYYRTDPLSAPFTPEGDALAAPYMAERWQDGTDHVESPPAARPASTIDPEPT